MNIRCSFCGVDKEFRQFKWEKEQFSHFVDHRIL